jgi:hypothetical protein
MAQWTQKEGQVVECILHRVSQMLCCDDVLNTG